MTVMILLASNGSNAPYNTEAPAISGTAKVGITLTVSTGSWNNNPSSYSYQWYNTSGLISGATSSSYTVQSTDDGKTIYCAVTATNTIGSTLVNSNTTATVTYQIPVNTVAPAISGTAQIGLTLTVSTGTWNNTPTSYTYQWYRSGVGAISSATSSSYTVQVADLNYKLYCAVTATNNGGSSSPVNSAETSTVTYQVPVNTVAPSLGGYSTVGYTLSVSTGSWNNSPTSYSYQWYNSAGIISGATSSSYSAQSSDIGYQIRCLVTASNASGSGTAYSSFSSTCYGVPSNTVAPKITPDVVADWLPKVGNTVSIVDLGSWTGGGTVFASSYQWYRGSSPIPGATSSEYVLQDADAGSQIKILLYVSNGNDVGATGSAYSNATGTVGYAPVNTVAPAITGSAFVGATLSCSTGTWLYSPTSYTYQWYRNGSEINGATSSTYTLVSGDNGSTIYCIVRAKNYYTGMGSGVAAQSNTTATIQTATPTITYMVVGGGGAGGAPSWSVSAHGGGGGGGSMDESSSISVTAGQVWSVTVGQGGSGSSYGGTPTSGSESNLYRASPSFVANAPGGGRGAGAQTYAAEGGGANYGGGGGGASGYITGASGTYPYGYKGGNATTTSAGGGGGGGATGAAGSNGDASTGGQGGRGYTSTYFTSLSYTNGSGGGGGGAYGLEGGAGGTGGGRGGGVSFTPSSGLTNRGGGGGGWSRSQSSASSGSGGSGMVAIRYSASYPDLSSTTGSPSFQNDGTYKTYRWTGSGSFTI